MSISREQWVEQVYKPYWEGQQQPPAPPVQQAASTSNGRSPQPYGDRYKYLQKQQAQQQKQSEPYGLSPDSLAGQIAKDKAEQEKRTLAQQLIADTLSKATNGRGRNYARAQYLEKQQADKSARYQSGVSSYGSSRAWADAEKDSYDKLSTNVESIAARLRELRLESAYGTAVYQDGIYMGEDEERRSWYDEQLSALGLELSNAEYEQSQAKWKMDEAAEFAEYDAWAEQQAEDQRLFEMAKSAGYDGESWYQGRVLQRDEAQANVEQLIAQRADLRAMKAYGSVVYQDGVYMGEDKNIIAQYDAQIAEVDRQIEAATEELRRKEASLKSAERTRYNDYMTDPNYVLKIASGRMYYEQIQAEDKQAEAVAQQQMKATAMSATPAAGISMAFQAMQADVSSLRPQDNWTKEEENTFLYILGSPGEDSLARAQEYAAGVNERYAMEAKYKQLAEAEEWAGKNVLTGTVGSVVSLGGFLLSGADVIADVAEYASTGKITAKPYASITELSNALTTGVKNSLNDWSGTTKIFGDERGLGDMYSVAMSIAQSYAAIAAGGGATGSMLYFFGNGMSNGINEALDRGAKPGQAMAYGTLAAVIEAATEKFSVDSLLSGKNLSSAFKAIARQAGVEASEEGMSYLLDRFADVIVLGNKNEYKQAVWSNTIDGMSYDEASKKALTDWWHGLAWTLTSGAFSGVLSSSAAQLYTGVSGGTGESPLVPPAQNEPKVEQATKAQPVPKEQAPPITEQAPAITEQAPPITEQAPPITEQAPAETAEQNKTAPVEGAAIKDETSYIDNKLRENIPELTNMQTVAQSRAEDVREIPHKVVDSNGNVIKISDGEEANQTSLMSPVDDAGASSPSNSPLKSENSEGVPSADSIAQAGEEGKGKNTTAATAPRREKSTALESDELSISERPERDTRADSEGRDEMQADAMGRAAQKAKKDIRSFARRLSEKLQSRKSYGTAAADMEWLAGRMLREELPAREVRDWARDIAEDMVEKAETTVDDMQEMREPLVSYLKATPLKVGAVEFGDIPQGWRKAHRQVRLHEQGLPIDAAWRELNEMFGEGVFPSDIYSQGDMLMHIGELLDNWKPRQANPHEGYRDELISEVAEEIYDELNRRVSRAAMDALRAEHKSELNEVRVEERAKAQEKLDKKQEQLDKARAQNKELREENKEIKAGMSAAVKTAIEDERTRQEERERRQQLTKSINKNVESLYKKLSENSGKRHVPEEMKSAVAGMLAAIDTRSKRAGGRQQQEFSDRMRELALVISEQTALQAEQGEQAVYLDLPAGVPAVLSHLSYKVKTLTEGENLFTGLDDYVWTLNSMDNEDLQTLSNTLTVIAEAVNKANNLMSMSGTTDEDGTKLIREMDFRAEKKTAEGMTEQIMEWDMLTPVNFFRRLGVTGEKMFKALSEGWGEFARKTERLQKDCAKMWTEKEVKDAEQNIITANLRWRIQDGDAEGESEALRSVETEAVRMTHAQAMDLYGLYMRPQGRGHILGAGIRVGNIKRGRLSKGIRQNKNYLLTDTDLIGIFQQLTDRERKLVEVMSRYMSTVGADWGNAVTMKRWGIHLFTEDHYWTIETDSRNRDARKIEKAGGESLYRLLNMGFTKPLTRDASNAVELKSAFDVFTNHMVDMAKYNTLALPLLDMMKILNYKQITAKGEKSGKYTTASVQKSLDKVYGEYAQRYWMQLMQDLNGNWEGGRIADPFGKLVSNYKMAAVGANLRVASLQKTSYTRAGAVLSARALLQGEASSGKKGWEKALKYSGTAKWKNMGYRDSDINANVRELVKGNINLADKIRNWSMKPAEMMDAITWGRLWNASEAEVKFKARDAGETLSEEDLIDRTNELFDEVIYRTQVMDSTLTRSQAMRNTDSRIKRMTSFMSEATVSYNLLLDEVESLRAAKDRTGTLKNAFMKNSGRIGRAFMVYTSSALMGAIVESIWDALRDDDDYVSFADKWWKAFWSEDFIGGNFADNLSIIGKLPLLKDVVNIFNDFDSNNMDVAGLTTLYKAFRAIQAQMREDESAANYYGKMTRWGAVEQGLKALSQLTGLPGYNAVRDAIAIWNNTVGAAGWADKIKSYDAGPEKNIRYAFEDGALTEESARALLVSEGVSEDADAAYWKVEAWKSGDGEYSKYDKLRDAMKEGNKNAFAAAMQELEEHGMYHQSVISDGVVSEIQQMYQGDNAEQIAPVIKKDEAISLLETYGEKRNGEAELLVSKWTSYLDEGIYYGSMKEAYVNEQISFDKAVSMRSKYGMMSEADARAEVLKWQCYKETGIEADNLAMAYAAGEISWEQLRDMYIKYEIYEEEKAASYADKAKFVGLDSYPGISYQATDAYWQYVPDMDKELYYQAWKDTKDMAGEDKDGNGRSDPYTKMDKILEYIDRLNLSKEQKDALARARGIAEKNLKRAPWNK